GTAGQQVFTNCVVNLSAYVGRNLRVRFLYSVDYNYGAYFGTSDRYGWFIDDILISNVSIGGGSTATPPAITQQPQSQRVFAGATVTFNAAATGTAPLRYQWAKDGVPITGASDPTLVLANV